MSIAISSQAPARPCGDRGFFHAKNQNDIHTAVAPAPASGLAYFEDFISKPLGVARLIKRGGELLAAGGRQRNAFAWRATGKLLFSDVIAGRGSVAEAAGHAVHTAVCASSEGWALDAEGRRSALAAFRADELQDFVEACRALALVAEPEMDGADQEALTTLIREGLLVEVSSWEPGPEFLPAAAFAALGGFHQIEEVD